MGGGGRNLLVIIFKNEVRKNYSVKYIDDNNGNLRNQVSEDARNEAGVQAAFLLKLQIMAWFVLLWKKGEGREADNEISL